MPIVHFTSSAPQESALTIRLPLAAQPLPSAQSSSKGGHKFEVRGTVPPWCVWRLCCAVRDSHPDEFQVRLVLQGQNGARLKGMGLIVFAEDPMRGTSRRSQQAVNPTMFGDPRIACVQAALF